LFTCRCASTSDAGKQKASPVRRRHPLGHGTGRNPHTSRWFSISNAGSWNTSPDRPRQPCGHGAIWFRDSLSLLALPPPWNIFLLAENDVSAGGAAGPAVTGRSRSVVAGDAAVAAVVMAGGVTRLDDDDEGGRVPSANCTDGLPGAGGC
jgi:hypothetical protein